jgi:hypothetical protein
LLHQQAERCRQARRFGKTTTSSRKTLRVEVNKRVVGEDASGVGTEL